MAQLSPEKALRIREILPYEDVKRMVENHGFELREHNGSSHVPGRHPEHSDIIFNINRSPKTFGPQEAAAKACLEVRKRERAQEVVVETEQNQSFPEDISVKTRDEVVILRHKKYPAIGMALKYDPEKNGLADISTRRASTLRNKASQFSERLREAEDTYGIEISECDDEIVVKYLDHEVVIHPYHTLSNQDPLEALEEVIEGVEQSLSSSNEFYDFIRSTEVASDFTIDMDSDKPTVSFRVTNGYTQHTTSLVSEIHPNGAISDMDQIKMIQDMAAHMFEPGTFKALKTRFGIHTRGKDNSQLVFTHPLFDLEARADNPRGLIKDARSVFERSVNSGDKNMEGYDLEWLGKAIRTWDEMGTFAVLVSEHMDKNREVIDKVNKDIRELGLTSKMIGFKKLGELCSHQLETSEGQMFTSRIMRVKYNGRQIETILSPNRIDDLNEFLEQARSERQATRPCSFEEPYGVDHDPIGDAVRSVVSSFTLDR